MKSPLVQAPQLHYRRTETWIPPVCDDIGQGRSEAMRKERPSESTGSLTVSYFYVNALGHGKLEVLGLILFMEDTFTTRQQDPSRRAPSP